MKISIVSATGFSLGLATRLAKEGHDVRFYATNNAGEGIVDLGQDDAIADWMIYDNTIYGKQADDLRLIGVKVLGASQWSHLIESDDKYRESIVEMLGWPHGTLDSGINLYLTCWFNGNNFISTYTSLVYRRFMSGGRGPDVKDTGVISDFYQPTERINSILRPLQPVLRKVNHRGCFHIQLLIKGDQFNVKSISTAIDTPLTLSLFENTNLAKTEVLMRMLTENSKTIQPVDRCCSSVLVSVPPYPYHIESESVEIKGLNDSNLKHVWLMNVANGGGYRTATDNGKTLYVTARGAYMQESCRRVYRTIGNLNIQDVQYRNDIGRDVHVLIDELTKHKWLKEQTHELSSRIQNVHSSSSGSPLQRVSSDGVH